MSFLQRLLKRICGAETLERLRVATELWHVTCPDGHSVDLRRAGGVRFGATGKKWTYGRCAMCESEFDLVEGSGNVFRDFAEPDADLKQAKAIAAARIIAVRDERGLTVR